MKGSVQKIRELIDSLPPKDIPLGYKFLETRDFEQLKELVDSAFYKIKKNLRGENLREDYLSLDLNRIEELQKEIDFYMIPLGIPKEYIDNDFEDEISDEISEDIIDDYY